MAADDIINPFPQQDVSPNHTLETLSTPPTRRKLELMDLPVDIITMFASYVIRPTDLKNLCLTCKQLHEITVRYLYRDVVVEVGGPLDGRLLSLVNPKNIGLRHIRQLDLYLTEVEDKCGQLQQANLAVRLLLEFLPENILDKFSWHPWTEFSSDNLKLLYRKQKNMKWMEAIALTKDIREELESSPDFDKLFHKVRKIGLYPDSRNVLNMCSTILKRSPKVEKITLHASFDEDHDDPSAILTRELNDSSTGPGLITSTIFGHMQPFESCTPLALKDLTLQKIHLRYAADNYCKFIDFKTVKALRIFGCGGADSLLAELSKSQKLPDKLEILEFKHEDNQENDALNALDGLLTLITGLKALTIDICYAKMLPSPAGITRHAKSLKTLNVHASRGDDDDEEELVYTQEEFGRITKQCTNLEQLSCAFPSTSIMRDSPDDFSLFGNLMGELQKLITLNITTWPTNIPSPSRLPRKIYEHLLQSMAQAGFEQAASRNPNLAVIAWGASDKVYDRGDSKNQIIFVKGRQIDPFGKEAPLAVQIGWCLRKYIEPRSEILDFALAKSCRPPTPEPPRSDDSD